MKRDFFGGGEGKGGKYFKRENTFMLKRRITGKEREENNKTKYIFLQRRIKTEKEKEKNIWRWKQISW